MRKLLLFLLLAAPLCSQAQQPQAEIPFDQAYKRTYNITRTDGTTPEIDGRLDEEFWQQQGEWSQPFVQVLPYERMPTRSTTRAKLLYDDRYIYVGVWCRDIRPDEINRFIGNRDENNVGDLISVAFDPYHDFRAGTEFNINVGGNKTDLVVTDRLEVNRSWNAVWDGRTHVSETDSLWTAELRIPFSQLRYNRETEDGVWGLHIRRIIRSGNEVQNWSLIPIKNSGHIYSFGEMHGMTDLARANGLELLPYTMGKVLREPRIAGSPYQKGTNWFGTGGLDGKVALSDFTLDFTINPDFGQVEVDPSVMNLTAYETFFEEKRPFFLEGKHILDFGFGGDMMFYTRRIGAQATYTPEGIDNKNSFAAYQENVPILGAIKLTGTNKRGLTIGGVQSFTARQRVEVSRRPHVNDAPADPNAPLYEERITTEPFTNYSIVRMQKNWDGNNTQLGGMVTSVNRSLAAHPHLQDIMTDNAFVGGVDFMHYFRDRNYYVDFKGMFSSLHGSKEAITRLQTNPIHYYQRASAQDYLGVDTSRTSLQGSGGYIEFGRRGNNKWWFSENISWLTPGFDLNDAGFLRQADALTNTTLVSYRQTDPGNLFRTNTVNISQRNSWDFGGRAVDNDISAQWVGYTTNRLRLEFSEEFTFNRVDSRMLRGGPDIRLDPFFTTAAAFRTDAAKRVYFEIAYQGDHSLDKINSSNSITPGVTLRIWDRIALGANFNTLWNRNNLQYVGSFANANTTAGSVSHVMSHLDQRTYGVTLRLQMNLTPDLSVQFYGSPFTSTGRYTDFKSAANTLSRNYEERFRSYSTSEISADGGEYRVGSSAGGFSFANPDFSFNEFRSNLVVRWEYLPGSTLYFVWEHRMSERAAMIRGWADNLDQMWGLPARNTLMLKLNYWINW
ncbi:MAG: carbohydrate binding family 9 domain-containing protein [Alistipes sp.]|jgi:hypothetical protein|nr:carbohydrate binding family 9 domain-containing protein [Alistipes sp.]